MSALLTAQLYPGRALGFFVLGAFLHDILTRVKAEPQQFPKIDVIFGQGNPVLKPVIVSLPVNGIRLQFDGPEQRLRMIEVVDFSKNRITFKQSADVERELVRPSSQTDSSSPASAEVATGPTFRHIYQRFLGPTYDGEYIPPNDAETNHGIYAMSYPGVAFNFPMAPSRYSRSKNILELLDSSTPQTAQSMAVFSGPSWEKARETLWTEKLPSIKTFPAFAKSKDLVADDISLIRIWGGGKLQLFRRWSSQCFWITLGETTPSILLAELGPPDAIFRRNEHKMAIHKLRKASHAHARPSGKDPRRQDDLTNTEQSSAHTAADVYESNDEAQEDGAPAQLSNECFWNYFYQGFDILVSTPMLQSRPAPSLTKDSVPENLVKSGYVDRLVACKIVIHANVPGSFPFNRHRRCRWEIAYLTVKAQSNLPLINSETLFGEVQKRLQEEWKSSFASETAEPQNQRGMVLNRGWGNSPGSSVEFLGGPQDAETERATGATRAGPKKFEENATTTLYGFPGLVFEVLKNGLVSAVTVY